MRTNEWFAVNKTTACMTKGVVETKKNTAQKIQLSEIIRMFASFTARTIYLTLFGAAFFIATHTARKAESNRLSNSCGCCTEKSVIVLAGTEGDSLSYFNNFSFSFMARTMKNQSMVNNSSQTMTSAHETRNSFLSFISSTYPNIKRLRFRTGKNRSYVVRGCYGPRQLFAQASSIETACALFLFEINRKVFKEPLVDKSELTSASC